MKLGDAFEQFIRTGKDAKGRTFGYVVGLRENEVTGECFAWVQKSVMNADGVTWRDFGPAQRSRKFKTTKEARAWAFATAKERAARGAA